MALTRGVLLHHLVQGTVPRGNGWLEAGNVPGVESLRAIAENGFVDYCGGRPIKTDLTGDRASTWLYDRDAGTGSFERMVKGIRAGVVVQLSR